MNTTTLIIITLTACLLSALCGALTIPQLLNYAKRKKIYDIPNQRKLHKNPIPRIGGVTFVPSMLLATILAITLLNALAEQHKNLVSTWTLTFLISLTIIYATGIIDDIIGATPKFKLIAQTIAATLLTTSGLYINNLYGLFGIHAIPTVIAIPLTIILILLITNAINLIDGIDGLAASLTLIALIAFLISFAREGLWVYAVLIAGLAGTLIPYLYYNIFGKIQNNTKPRIPLRQVRNAQPQRHAIQKRKPTTLHHNTHRTSSRCHQSSIHPTSTTQTPVHSRQKPYSPQTHPSKIHTTPGTHHHPALRHILRTSQHHTLQSRTTTRHCHTPHRHRHTHLFPSHYKSAKKTHTTADKQRPITPETEPPKNKKSVPVSALIFIGRSARARPAREKTKNDASADATSWNATLNDYRLTPQC